MTHMKSTTISAGFAPAAWQKLTLHSQTYLSIIALVGVNGSYIMKITKTLVVTLLAGFSLTLTALCQTNAADTTPAATSDTTTNSAAAAPATTESAAQPATAIATNG